MTEQIKIGEMTLADLIALKGLIELKIEQLSKGKTEQVILTYNTYKGSGKAWIAITDKRDYSIQSFLDHSNNIKNGYKGEKFFDVPLVEGRIYLFCAEGTKSSDSRYYQEVINGKLELYKRS